MTSRPAAAQPGASRAGQIAVVAAARPGSAWAIAAALAQAGTDDVLASRPAARCARAAAGSPPAPTTTRRSGTSWPPGSAAGRRAGPAGRGWTAR
jgi:hypothetical protein